MKRVLLNSFSGGVLFLVLVVAAFVLTPVIVHSLGNLAYGAWEIILSIMAYLMLLDLGINPAVIRFVARGKARGDLNELRSVFSSALLFASLVGLLGLIVLWVVAIFPERVLNLQSGDVPGLRSVLMIMGVGLLAQFTGTIFVDVLMGFQRHYLVNAVKIVNAILRTTAIYFALTKGGGSGIVWLAAIHAGGSLIQNGVLAGVLLTSMPDLRIGRGSFSWPVMRKLYAFGLKSMTLMAAQRIQKQLMPILIGWVLGVGQVVFFTLPSRLIDYGYDLILSLGFPLTAHFSELDGKGNIENTRNAWFNYTRYLQLVMFGFGIGILALGEYFLGVWIGQEYAEAGRWIVRLLALGMLVQGVAPNAGRLLVAFNMHGRAAAWSLLISLLSIPVSVLFAVKFGIVGLAGSVLLSRTALLVVISYLAFKVISITLIDHLRKTVLLFVVPMGLQAATLWVLISTRPPESYPALMLQAMISLVPYFLSSWRLAMKPEDRQVVLRWVASKLKQS